METVPESAVPDLKKNILSRIEGEGICPRSRFWYLGKECAVWSVWLATIAIAAVAVAVSIFIVVHRQFAFFEATHDTFLSFMFEVLPYLWFLVFSICAAFAIYHFRHTKRGYRYSFLSIIGATVIASATGGVVLHYLGMSFAFDNSLGKYMPGLYMSQEMKEKQFWQQPQEGRLLVTFSELAADGKSATVVDVNGQRWEVNVVELFVPDRTLLEIGKPVRLLGRPVEAGSAAFYACGVFPWMYDRMMSIQEFRADRELAIQRLHDHRDRMMERAKASVEAMREGELPPPPPEVRCGEIEAVKRLRD